MRTLRITPPFQADRDDAGPCMAQVTTVKGVTPNPLASDVDGDLHVKEGELIGNDGRE